MKACRVCLAMRVKMYHMSKHQLSVMYQRVTGVEITTEDRLPKMLCWECVARLSSANHFREKAFKTHSILSNRIKSNRFITMSDIESIDKAEHQLSSTLGFKYNKEPNFHIIKENDTNNEVSKANIYETSVDCKIEFEREVMQNIKTEVEEIDESDPIKIEYFDPNKEKNVEDLQIPKSVMRMPGNLSEEVPIDHVNFVSVKSEDKSHFVDETEAWEKLSRKRKRASETPLRGSQAPHHSKELRLDLEDVKSGNEDSFKQDTDNVETAKDIEVLCYRPIKKESMFTVEDNFLETATDGNNTHTVNYQPIKQEVIFAVENNFMETAPDSGNTYTNPSYEHFNITDPGSSGVDSKHNDPESSKSFICHTCDKRYSNKKTLKQHRCGQAKLLSCTYCSFKAYRKLQLKLHINSKHTKSDSFVCDYCGYVSYRKDYLAIHIKTKHIKRVYYDCTYCKYKSTRKYILREHINNKHTRNISSNAIKSSNRTRESNKQNKSYICPLCNFEATRQFTLREHIHTNHTKSLTFKCDCCPYRTHNRYCLKNHIKNKHTKEKEYFCCSYCDYKAQHKHRLSEHINSQHTKKTKYDCTYCSFQTYHRTSLTCHVNAKHTKTDSYKCSHCSFKTFHKYKYTQHVKLKHPENWTVNLLEEDTPK